MSMIETKKVKKPKIFKKRKKNNLYLSDKPPLNLGGKITLGVSYVFLIIWSIIVLAPIFQIVVSSFNGGQAQ